jgi:CheY-like chemotaxis protein
VPIVDDEPQILRALRINLHARHYDVVTAADGAEALHAAATYRPYAQSTNPNSPYCADQTRLYSQHGRDTIKYTNAQLAADHNLRTYLVREDKRDCMNGGWQKFEQWAFASQRGCIAYLQRIGLRRPDDRNYVTRRGGGQRCGRGVVGAPPVPAGYLPGLAASGAFWSPYWPSCWTLSVSGPVFAVSGASGASAAVDVADVLDVGAGVDWAADAMPTPPATARAVPATAVSTTRFIDFMWILLL